MVRIILAVLAGNFLWTLLWLGLNAVLQSASLLPAAPDQAVQGAVPLLIMLVGSVAFSVLAGYACAAVAMPAGAYRSVVALAILQLVIGAAVQAGHWSQLPLWYHVAFLSLLVPATLLGGRLRLGAARPPAGTSDLA